MGGGGGMGVKLKITGGALAPPTNTTDHFFHCIYIYIHIISYPSNHRRCNPPGCPEKFGRPGRVAPMLLILYPESTRSSRAARRIDLCIHDAYASNYQHI